jgi:hypothetical protein
MKKIFTEFFSLVLFPILLAINYYTGHFGPIFILDCIYVIAGVIMGFGIWLIFSVDSEKYSDAFAAGFKKLNPWKVWLAYSYWTVAAAWFIYFEYYVSFILLAVYVFLYKFYIFSLKEFHENRSSV